MGEIEKDFPPGLAYDIGYNPTEFIAESVTAVEYTVFEAIVLVVIVIIAFLQTWRVAIIPIVAIPISLIVTFAVMSALGYSLNNLTLFGMVLAIGIVVDDAIVVVENMERNMRKGMSPREAAHKTMDEVGSALLAMGLVLVAVFLPTTFLEGLSWKFYQAFGVTIAVATVISVFVSLTLSPALAAILMTPHRDEAEESPPVWYRSPHKVFFAQFNAGMEGLSRRYGELCAKLVRKGFLVLLVYVGITNTVGFTGFHGATRAVASNSAAIFATFDSFDEREQAGLTFASMLADLRQQVSTIKEAKVVVLTPPPVRGIGSSGGFRMMIQDRGGRGLEVLNESTLALAATANDPDNPAVNHARSFFDINTPQIFLDIDRDKAERLRIPVARIFEALEVFIGSAFVNDFNYLGRTYRVTAQADAP
jgi:multidrug efflux pump subunit AcrB